MPVAALAAGVLAVVTAAAQAGVAAAERSQLSAAQLQGAAAAGPWAMAAFAPPPGARQPSHQFSGRLLLDRELPGGGFRVRRDQYGDAQANGGAAQHLPPFDFALLQSGDALIPQQRGAVRSEHPAWEFVLEPGRVWDERGDGGLTRAALPFALEERNANCLHNGVLTFLFGDGGRISHVAWEIGTETCAYFQFDAWGLVQARYRPAALPDAERLATQYRRQLAARLPTRPMARLAADHPGSEPDQFGSPREIAAADMTLYGLIVDGVHYAGGCETRFGPYPYCDELDLPSYSLAKTLVGGLAVMRAALLDAGVTAAPVASLVPECAQQQWDEVSLGAVLDMASGHYDSDADQHDENSADLLPFFLAEDHASRIRFACGHYPRRMAAGSKWVYHTSDTYLLGSALAAWYRRRAGATADFYDDLLRPIWHRLELSPALDVPRRTRDASNQPFTGYGLTLLRDDVARLAMFLALEHGRRGSEQLIDAAMLRAALQQDPAHPGLEASNAAVRYHNGLWAWNAQQALGCPRATWIPFMSGFGGITVAMFPNGLIYYYFSDGGVFAWSLAARAADHIRPFCRAAA